MHQVPRGRAPFRTPRALPSVQSLLLVNLCVVVVVAAVSGGARVNSSSLQLRYLVQLLYSYDCCVLAVRYVDERAEGRGVTRADRSARRARADAGTDCCATLRRQRCEAPPHHRCLIR